MLSQRSAQLSTDKIVTKELHIVDDEGKTRIVLSVHGGEPTIKVLDSLGNLRIDAGIFASNQVGIFITDQEGKHRAALHVYGNESQLQLFDKNANLRANLIVQDNEVGDIAFASISQSPDKGTKRAIFSIADNGSPQLQSVDTKII